MVTAKGFVQQSEKMVAALREEVGTIRIKWAEISSGDGQSVRCSSP